MTIRRKLLDDGLTLLILFLATGAFESMVVDLSAPRANTDGSLALEIIWFLVYGAVFLRLIPHYRQTLALVRANMWLLLLVLLAICSIIWSGDPELTLRRGVALLATTLIGIDIAVRYPLREQVRLLCVVLGAVVVLGIVAQLFFPTLVPGYSDPDAWHGVSGHKNEFARSVVLATVVVLCRPRRSLRDFVLIATVTVAAFGLVVLAHSSGALVILITLLLLYKTFGVLRWRRKNLAVACLVGALIVLPMSYLTFENFGKATALFGRDATLTGRVGVWRLALSSIASKPIHGYGYSAFWDGDSQEALRLREESNWSVPHGHNGYIDMTLELGLAGLCLFITGYIIAARRAISCLRRTVEREAMWPLVFLSFFFLYQLIEGSLVSGNTIYWILYVAACFSAAKVTALDQPALKSYGEFAVPKQMIPLGQEQ
jgi:exopolysaccharide production protein ExoQ